MFRILLGEPEYMNPEFLYLLILVIPIITWYVLKHT